MASKYFTVEVKPTIPASTQTASFGNDELLFDWTSFQVPRGANKLIAATVIHRAGIAGATTIKDLDLIFAKTVDLTAPATLGTVNGTVSAAPVVSNHCLGITHLDSSGDFGGKGLDYWAVGSTGSGAGPSNIPSIILEGEINSGDNVGYDTLYVGGITAENGHDFSTSIHARGAASAAATSVPTDDTNDIDPNADLIFAVGDTIHSETDDVLGTLTSIAAFSANNQALGFSAGITDDVSDDEELFNINPIRVILSFER